MSKLVVVCDIDNVYTDSREWEKLLPTNGTREEWDKYHLFSYLVKPNNELIDALICMNDLIPVFFVTSREDMNNMRDITVGHIEGFSHGKLKINERNKLFMRKAKDYRSPSLVKEEILLNEIINKGFSIEVAVDDSIENIEMFKKHGIKTQHYTKFVGGAVKSAT